MTADIITLPTPSFLCQQFQQAFGFFTAQSLWQYVSMNQDQQAAIIEQACDELRKILAPLPDRAERSAEEMNRGLRDIFFHAEAMISDDCSPDHICGEANKSLGDLLMSLAQKTHHHQRHQKTLV